MESLTNLTRLGVGANSIDNIDSLSGLTELTELNLYENTISEIDALENLTNLYWLTLFDNQISDISVLVKNPGIGSGDKVNLKRNNTDCSVQEANIQTLPDRGVELNSDCE